MKEKLVLVATLLGVSAEEFEAAFNAESNESLTKIVNGWKENNTTFSKADFETFKGNLLKEHEKNLSNLAKEGKLEPSLYGTLKGMFTEMNEKDVAKEFGITNYSGLADLVSKIKALNSSSPDVSKLNKQIEDLQKANTELDEKLKNIDSDYQAKYESKEIETEMTNSLNAVKSLLNVPQEALEKQFNLLKSAAKSDITIKKVDGKIVAFKGDVPVRNQATLEPIPLVDVFKQYATESGFNLKAPDQGGRGDSTKPPVFGSYKGMSTAKFEETLKEKGFLPGSEEARAEYKLYKTENEIQN